MVDLFRTQEVVTAQLPTGYGKTRTAACSYLTLRARGVCNRMLYIVPRSAQAKQAADGLPREILDSANARMHSFEVGLSPVPALKAHRAGSAEIFVVTIQSLVSSPAAIDSIVALMQTGRWFVVIDEHHHYGDDDKVWTQRVMTLPFVARLAMSATPKRLDGKTTFGEPDVVVTYYDAYKEGCVKGLDLHSYEYRIDAIDVASRTVITYTLPEIFAEAGSTEPDKIDKFMASRQVRWSPKYISPLVTIPLHRIKAARLCGFRFQMLVQAMSCLHAKLVYEQIKSQLSMDGMQMSVDWVGTGPNGRPQDQNDTIIAAFCPAKNAYGKRPWTLDILVNVGMAGEGMDCTDVTEVVFLTSPTLNNTSLQIIGRGARLMPDMPDDQQVCTINVDSASDISGFVGSGVMGAFDGVVVKDSAEGEGNKRKLPLLPEDPGVGITDVVLVDIKKAPYAAEVMKSFSGDPALSDMSEDDRNRYLEQRMLAAIRLWHGERTGTLNQTSLLHQMREKCTHAANRVVHRKLEQENKALGGLPKDRMGDLFKAVHGKAKKLFGEPSKADLETLQRRYKWFAELDRQIESGKVPSWL